MDKTELFDESTSPQSATDLWLIESVKCLLGEKAHEWHVMPAVDSKRPWILAQPEGATLPAQGWKLHVSSYGSQAAETLQRVLPLIIKMRIAFKVIGSLTWLSQVNRGSAGLSQVGKFITIYPYDDSEAVNVAIAVAGATRELRGPEIPSDRAIKANGVLYYRYGAFSDLQMQNRLGEILPALIDPDGKLEPDRRSCVPHHPSWVNDPFIAHGLGAASRLSKRVDSRYQPVLTLGQSPGVLVQLALDIVSLRTCVLKRANLRGSSAVSYNDPGSRLQREGALLAQMTNLGVTPQLYDVVNDDEELTLVIEDLGTETLEKYISALAVGGRFAPYKRVVELVVALIDALSTLHDHGYIHGDLKSTNIVIGTDNRLRLIDLDLAHLIKSNHRAFGSGTRGYTSPGCRTGAQPLPTDDIYALGAVLYFLTTGAEPSRAPNAENLLSRPPAAINPTVYPSIVTIIERCLSDDPDQMFSTVRDVRNALVEHNADAEDGRNNHDVVAAHSVTADKTLLLARRAADHICAQAELSNQGLVWRSMYYVGKGFVSRDISSGMAGTLLALAEMVEEFREQVHIDVLQQGANTLTQFRPFSGDQPSGLYIGEAGVVAALLRVGQVLDDTSMVDTALRQAHSGAHCPITSPDLFHGAAGRLLVYLLLWDETKDTEILGHAIQMGEMLLSLREGGPGEARWRIPSGYADLSGKYYLGYAHGAAGIADILLDLYETTGDQRFADTSIDAISWIVRQAVPVLDDQSGFSWPQVENGRPHPPFWCHGATGIGRLLLHAARLEILEDASNLLFRTSRSVARGARWSGPTLCHGLAGNIELLLDMAQWTGESRFLNDADHLLSLTDAFLVESDDGCAWISDAPRQINPDYLVGYGGIALVCLRRARLNRAYQLSRMGFRYRSALK